MQMQEASLMWLQILRECLEVEVERMKPPRENIIQYDITKPGGHLTPEKLTSHSYRKRSRKSRLPGKMFRIEDQDLSHAEDLQLCEDTPESQRESTISHIKDTAETTPQDADCSKQRSRKRWSLSETEALCMAVKECGVGKWKAILDSVHGKILNEHGRTNIDLKDKWRNLKTVYKVDGVDSLLSTLRKESQCSAEQKSAVKFWSRVLFPPTPNTEDDLRSRPNVCNLQNIHQEETYESSAIKYCSRCGLTKLKCEFHKDKTTKDKRKGQCKDCKKKYYQNRKKESDEGMHLHLSENESLSESDAHEEEVSVDEEWTPGAEYERRRSKRRKADYNAAWYQANKDKPEYKQKKAAWRKAYRATPEQKKRQAAQQKAYRASRLYRQRIAARQEAYRREIRQLSSLKK